MNVNTFLQNDPPAIIPMLPRMSYCLSSMLQSNGEKALVFTYYYTPTEVLSDERIDQEEILSLIMQQQVLGQIIIPKSILLSSMFQSAMSAVIRE